MSGEFRNYTNIYPNLARPGSIESQGWRSGWLDKQIRPKNIYRESWAPCQYAHFYTSWAISERDYRRCRLLRWLLLVREFASLCPGVDPGLLTSLARRSATFCLYSACIASKFPSSFVTHSMSKTHGSIPPKNPTPWSLDASVMTGWLSWTDHRA